MSTLNIKKDINLKDIERLLESIVDANSEIILRLPNSLKYSGTLGIEGQIIQLIVTWLRKNDGNSKFHSYIKDDYVAENFEDLCSSMYGICILSLADNLLTEKSKPIRRRTALETAIKRITGLRNLKFTDAFKGPYLGIPLIKAPRYKNEFDSPFYNGDSVVNRTRFFKITEQALQSVLQKHKCQDIIDEAVVTNISSIIYELFTNTDKHARRDETGNILSKNFRCVTFNSPALTEKQLDNWVSSYDEMFFAASWKSKLKEHSMRFLEISVIDSGPGFARRWRGLPKSKLTIEDQKEAIIACFQKYRTTDLATSAGSGLTNVMLDIRKLKGWFKLRTGNIFLEKSFLGEKVPVSVSRNDLKQTKAFAEGVSISFVIPLPTLSNKE